jgi:hypothetical protein
MKMLEGFGRIMRIRVARNSVTLKCKGYGYTWIVLNCTEPEFTARCLNLTPPILAYAIPGPKLLGAENTKLLRRYAQIEGQGQSLPVSQVLEHMETYGKLEFISRERDRFKHDFSFRLQLIFEDEEAAKKVSLIENHKVGGLSLTVHTFIGLQECPFELFHDSLTEVIRSEFPLSIYKMNQKVNISEGSISQENLSLNPMGRRYHKLAEPMEVNARIKPEDTYSSANTRQPGNRHAPQPHDNQNPLILNKSSKIDDFKVISSPEIQKQLLSSKRNRPGTAVNIPLDIIDARHVEGNIRFNICLASHRPARF